MRGGISGRQDTAERLETHYRRARPVDEETMSWQEEAVREAARTRRSTLAAELAEAIEERAALDGRVQHLQAALKEVEAILAGSETPAAVQPIATPARVPAARSTSAAEMEARIRRFTVRPSVPREQQLTLVPAVPQTTEPTVACEATGAEENAEEAAKPLSEWLLKGEAAELVGFSGALFSKYVGVNEFPRENEHGLYRRDELRAWMGRVPVRYKLSDVAPSTNPAVRFACRPHEKELRSPTLGWTRFITLQMIIESPGCTQDPISQLLYCGDVPSTSAVLHITRELELAGLVTFSRRIRQQTYTATPKGLEVCAATLAYYGVDALAYARERAQMETELQPAEQGAA